MDNPLRSVPIRASNSPTDPQECCYWANSLMRDDLAADGYAWVVTGDPKQPIALRRPK
jgi:hypothetical protein